MKNLLFVLLAAFIFSSCGAGAETPESIAKTWCDMQKKIKSLEKGDEKTKLKQKQHDFEQKIEAKYKDDKEFMDKVEKLADACH